jgi:hypothetical protein
VLPGSGCAMPGKLLSCFSFFGVIRLYSMGMPSHIASGIISLHEIPD